MGVVRHIHKSNTSINIDENSSDLQKSKNLKRYRVSLTFK
jgi:hypothetical protein